MPITRAKARQLLNQKEMALYDESRVNGLRQLDAKALATRITRARAARARARDLVRRQKLDSRTRTGSKRGTSGTANQRSKDKAELMADILGRFETHLRELDRPAAGSRKTASKKTVPKKVATRKVATKSATRKATARKTSTGKAATKKAATKKAAAKKAAAKTGTTRSRAGQAVTRKAAGSRLEKKTASTTAVGRKTAKAPQSNGQPDRGRQSGDRRTGKADTRASTPKVPASGQPDTSSAGSQRFRTASQASSDRRAGGDTAPAAGSRTRRPRKRPLTPEQALAQTQALLEAKQARDSEPKPWADIGGEAATAGSPGYQSDSAARRAKRLHAAEMRLPANQGSISTHDRINQGKRDRRNRTDN